MTANRTRAVVFDFGGVLITTIGNQVVEIGVMHDVDARSMHELLLGPRDSTHGHPWHRAERGELSDRRDPVRSDALGQADRSRTP